AEDGIRDFHVTGVQTCALPICCSDGQFMRTSPPGRLPALLALSQAAGLIDHLALTGMLEATALDRLLDDLLENASLSSRSYPLGDRTSVVSALAGEPSGGRNC